MKAALRRMVEFATARPGLYRVLDATVLRFARYAEWVHRVQLQDGAAREAIARVSPDLVVLHGPFAGLRYPAAESTGSCLFPKLLGSYERELHGVIERVCSTEYSDVVDVGCAEGYYAVGLARCLRSARVYAFDTNPAATSACTEMARVNGVVDRVSVGGFCDPQTLMSLPLGVRALVVSDCEGYEKDLFTADVVAHLAAHDVLVEAHDQVDIEISKVLQERFAATHDTTVVPSIDDVEKAYTYEYRELEGYSLTQRRVLLGEERSIIMRWLFFTPKVRSKTDALQ